MTETSRAFAGEHGAMNNWDKIWKKRTAEIENRATVFEMFKELKRADGFDTQDVQGYYEAFFRQWECMAQPISYRLPIVPAHPVSIRCAMHSHCRKNAS